MGGLVGVHEEARIVAGVDDFQLVVFGIEFEEDAGDVALACFGTFGAVLVVETRDEFGEGKAGADAGAKGGAEGGRDDSGGEALAGDVGYGHDLGAIGKRDDVDAVAADLVTGAVADGDGVAGDLGHVLRNEAALNGAGGVEILLDAGPGEAAFVVAGVFDGNGGLEGEALEEVFFVNGEGAAVGSGDNDFGDAVAVFIVQGEAEAALPRLGRHCAAGHVRLGVEGAREFEFANDDAEDGGEDFFEADGGVDLAGSFEQGLEADDLLLEVEGIHGRRGWHWCRHGSTGYSVQGAGRREKGEGGREFVAVCFRNSLLPAKGKAGPSLAYPICDGAPRALASG